MKVSRLEDKLAELKALIGDVDVLDEHGFNIDKVQFRKASEGELDFGV